MSANERTFLACCVTGFVTYLIGFYECKYKVKKIIQEEQVKEIQERTERIKGPM